MPFKPNENTGTRIVESPEVRFSKEQFIDDVFNGEYILAVGSEVILNRDVEPSGDVNKYILSSLNRVLPGGPYADFTDLMNRTGEGVDPVRNLLNSVEFAYDVQADTSPELRALLGTRLFSIVLTTTFDNYLELIMREIWGDRLRVVDIADKKSLDDLRNRLTECRGKRKYNEPTLFYIFGKAVPDESKPFVRTDDDAIRIIERWMLLSKDDPVLKLVRNKKLLALGCKFDDWYFRFFWYILKREVNRFPEGQVAFMLDSKNVLDNKLQLFLRRSKIYRHDNARSFMDEITHSLLSTDDGHPFREMVKKYRKTGGVFISYSSQDVLMASQLFFTLRREGFNVWFDNSSLHGGDDYNEEIRKGIAASRVVITLLSPHVARDLNESRTDNYYNKEWRMARQLVSRRIIPLAIDGYDVRKPYHTERYEEIVGKGLSGIDLMDNDGLARLLDVLDESLAKDIDNENA